MCCEKFRTRKNLWWNLLIKLQAANICKEMLLKIRVNYNSGDTQVNEV